MIPTIGESFRSDGGLPEPGVDWPDVAVVMPILNEGISLRPAVEAVLAQGYPGRLTVCLALAPSSDDTEATAEKLAADHDDVVVVTNPVGTTPVGLNAAIRATPGDVIVRVDGHAELSSGYIRRAVETLDRTGAVNVGGMQNAVGTTPFEVAVAAALSSRFGSGGAEFRSGGKEGPTDTVYLGVFRRDAIEAVGLFDERLVRNQDYELNIRLRGAGGLIWFNPELVVTYRPRGSLSALARQYFGYGRWKRVVITQHPASMRLRQAVPPLTTVILGASMVLSLRWRKALVLPGLYAAAVIVAATTAARSRGAIARLFAIFPAMHLSYGAGFFVGPRGSARTRVPNDDGPEGARLGLAAVHGGRRNRPRS